MAFELNVKMFIYYNYKQEEQYVSHVADKDERKIMVSKTTVKLCDLEKKPMTTCTCG